MDGRQRYMKIESDTEASYVDVMAMANNGNMANGK